MHAVGMVSREGSEGEESSITAVFEGNVTAELNEISDTTVETETVAISLENENGAMDVAVEGDVTAKGAKDNFGIYVEAAEGTDTDILVDGPFLIEKKNISLPFRGSENQRIIDVKESLKKREPVLSPLMR